MICGCGMVRFHARSVVPVVLLVLPIIVCAQKAPSAPERPWVVDTKMSLELPPRPVQVAALDASKVYSLSELVNLAEQNNPETRVAWEAAKARSADLGIAKSSLYPTLAAAALAQSERNNIFFAPTFYQQIEQTFSPAFSLDYVIFDFGRRSAEIAVDKGKLIAANFQFNDAHRKVIFKVMQTYYRLLDTSGLRDAAEANLKNAETVQHAAEARLEQGLATLPDVLEARSAAAQADYDLQAAIGATEIAHGDLAEAIGLSPTIPIQVVGIEALEIPADLTDTVETSIDRALTQRPDLMQRVAQIRAADSEVKAMRTAYLPTLSLDGTTALPRSAADQAGFPGTFYSTQGVWSARLNLSWTIFDGLARENRISRAKADQRQAIAELDATRDQVENQVWSAYSMARTALRQQKAAAALLAAASESYNAAIESYTYGVRSQIDVVSAQRALASARTADVTARTQLLSNIAALAFQTGDLLHSKVP
jgi:outer membrane protein